MYAATCKSLHELRALFAPLWSRYAAPWVAARDARTRAEERGDDPATIPSLPEPRQLFAALQSGEPSEKSSTKTASVVSGADPAVPPSAEGKEAASGEETASENAASGVGGTLKRKRAWTGPVLHAGLTVPLSPAALALDRGHVWPVPEDDVAGRAGGALDFDIPRLTKFMLVSAHLATMNREGVDRRLFGHMVEGVTPGTSAIAGGPKKRSRGAMGADKQQEAAAEAAAEGPGAFHLERLLAYFRIVTKQAYDEDDAGSEDLNRELLSADVFMQISSWSRWGC
jgi:origin recognition complex subunit 5